MPILRAFYESHVRRPHQFAFLERLAGLVLQYPEADSFAANACQRYPHGGMELQRRATRTGFTFSAGARLIQKQKRTTAPPRDRGEPV